MSTSENQLKTVVYERPRQVAQRFGVSRSTLYRWAKLGIIPQPVRMGERVTLWDVEALEKCLKIRNGGENDDHQETEA